MTHEDIVYDRRVRLVNYAAEIGNVAQAYRVFGVSRKTYYEWLKRAEQHGLSALLRRNAARRTSPTRDHVAGRTPVQVKKQLRRRLRQTAA